MSRLEGRIALITGASRGIGAAVAKRLAAEGAHVILTARTVGGLEETDDAIFQATGKNATLVPLNLMEFDKIDALGLAVYERFKRLDILVSNAGVLETLGPIAQFEPKHMTRIVDTNITANYRLIRSFDRLLRASDAGRAIFVTSGAAAAPYPYWGPYGMSKAALEYMVKTYAMEIAASPLRVNLVDPGKVATRMRTQAFPGEDQRTLPQPDDITSVFADLASPDCTSHGEVVAAY